ncbi:MAG TPA: glutamate-5-semialdehyde dehydrogenase [Alphaproteobacteria bacterium]|nr:glutamate-5-semialdehyde dehydrogenase [Alphaproteobacteria bacterium]
MTIKNKVIEICKKAKLAATELATLPAAKKNKALLEAAKQIRKNSKKIIAANAKDVKSAAAKGQTKAFLDRLMLDEKRIEAIAKGLEEVARLPDPVGRVLEKWQRPNGLEINRISTPLGVIGIIFESRPNVTADAGALCLKSGNAAILRCGSESINSSLAIADCLKAGLKAAGINKDVITLIPFSDREAVDVMLNAVEYIDVIVPRGGKGLVKKVIEGSKIPMFQHLEGNNHTYIHSSADVKMTVDIVVNAKMRRTGVCGATETIVIDEKILKTHLPKIAEKLIEKGCEIRADEKAIKLDKRFKKAKAADWETEYLDSIVAVKVVKNFEEGLKFVKKYSSHHTDAIIANDKKLAERFLNEVDSAIVIHNSSTQFADGGEFGFGGEIGIATGKMHARGPVGPAQLCTFKYIVKGKGQVRGG